MPKEIERKFLVNDHLDLTNVASAYIYQGYIARTEKGVVRVRIKDNEGFITVKSRTKGISRDEYEYTIPTEEAQRMLDSLTIESPIEKRRYYIVVGKHTWEVDCFEGENSGLRIAEIELEEEEEIFVPPDWLDREVTHDYRYSNSSLAAFPYSKWKETDKD